MGDAVIAEMPPDRGSVNRPKQTWVPPTAVTAQVKHQPSQWNIGSVHRYFDPRPRPEGYAIATD